MEHIEAVVVLGSDDDELHTSSFGQCNNSVRIEPCWIEICSESRIFVERNWRVRHDLLAVSVVDLLAVPYATQRGVEAEVNEHAELPVLPLLDGRLQQAGGQEWSRLIERGGVGMLL